MYMKISARLFILLIVSIAIFSGVAQPVDTLPDLPQQIDTLRTLQVASDSELNAIHTANALQAAELKQLKKQHAALLAENKQMKSNLAGLESELATLQERSGSEDTADLVNQIEAKERYRLFFGQGSVLLKRTGR